MSGPNDIQISTDDIRTPPKRDQHQPRHTMVTFDVCAKALIARRGARSSESTHTHTPHKSRTHTRFNVRMDIYVFIQIKL